MSTSVGIVGAGIMGRLLGMDLATRGWRVTLFDRDTPEGARSCTWASAGMIAPSSELESAEPEVAVMGHLSMERWPALADELGADADFRQQGSLIVAHPNDRRELERLREKVRRGASQADFVRALAGPEVHQLEPSINPQFQTGLFMTAEAQVDNRGVLRALQARLQALGVAWQSAVEVDRVAPHQVKANGTSFTFDWVVDCRGLGAARDLPRLRGVRGELVYVRAPEVRLQRPVRLMHPRYPIYIVPRREHVYVVGATAIESQDDGPATVRSVLELLSAAYTVHSGFAEARLLETVVGLRPAFSDNRPRILHQDGLLRINGLYRHGFLISPVMSRWACAFLAHGKVPDDSPVFEEDAA